MTNSEIDGETPQITDLIRDAIWSGSSDMSDIDYVNPAFENLWGRTSEEIRRSPQVVLDAVHPDFRDRLRAVLKDDPDAEWVMPFQIVRQDGSRRLVEAHGFAPVDGKRVGICRDITEPAGDHRAIGNSSKMFAEMGRAAKIGGWEFDPETLIGSFSDEIYRIFDLPSGRVSTVADGINSYHRDDRAVVSAAVQDAFDKGVPFDLDVRVVTAAGNTVNVHTVGRPEIVDGHTVKLWGTIQDITERKANEAKLALTAKRLETVLDTAPDGVAVVGPDGVIEVWSRACEAMFGYTTDQAVGRPISDLIIAGQELAGHIAKMTASELPGSPQVTRSLMESEGRRADGSTVPFELAIQRSEESGQKFSVGVFRDITERVEHRETMARLLEQLIAAMARTVENRDPYTAGHQRRVRDLSAAIAAKVGMGPEEIRGVSYGAMIHDIGKMAVPAEILNRPGKLTELEFKMIKNHSNVGAEIISGVEFPWPVLSIVLQHHERLDGSGYPNGLTGDEISIEARIVAVADVVEAMSSHRPYRPAMGVDAALAEISKNRDLLFDTDIVDACLALFRDDQFTFVND